jgi:tetratricopeptide (TPR) repeat protein
LKHAAILVSLVLAVILQALDLNGAEVASPFKEGEELLDGWHIAQAEELASRSLRENPKSAATLEFDGRVKFYQGRYPEALKSLEEALALDSKDERRQGWKLLTQQTQDVLKTLKRFESDHFVLFIDDRRDGILAPYALETLEKSYQAIFGIEMIEHVH